MKLMKPALLFSLVLGALALLPEVAEAQECFVGPYLGCRAGCRTRAWLNTPSHCKWLTNRRNRCVGNHDNSFRFCINRYPGWSNARRLCVNNAREALHRCTSYANSWYYTKLAANAEVRRYCQNQCAEWRGPCVHDCIKRVRANCEAWWTPISARTSRCYTVCRKRHCSFTW